jgi:hypothetical protein
MYRCGCVFDSVKNIRIDNSCSIEFPFGKNSGIQIKLMSDKSFDSFSRLKTHKSIETQNDRISKRSINKNNEPKVKKGRIKLKNE